jgi:autotransporter-associated beta strand protein
MKTNNVKFLLLAVCICFTAFRPMSAATTTETVTVSGTTTTRTVVSGTLIYNIADGVELTFTGTSAGAAGGAFNIASGNSLVIKPEGDLKTGRVIFEALNTPASGNNGNAGAIYIGGAGATALVQNAEFSRNFSNNSGGAIYIAQSASVSLVNTDFIQNTAASDAGAIRISAGWLTMSNVEFDSNAAGATLSGGAIYVSNSSVTISGESIVFTGNHAGLAGAVRNQGQLSFSGAKFTGNYSTGGAGAIYTNQARAMTELIGAEFAGNRAAEMGGAIRVSAGITTLENAVISDNWAGTQGGALYGATSAGNAITIRLTPTGGTNRYYYTGNIAGSGESPFDVVADTAPVAVAKAGGFYYNPGESSLIIDVAGGVTLEIGAAAGGARAVDSIASGPTVGRGLLEKQGDGTVLLHANNAYYSGSVAIRAGRLLLGNDEARLGGIITTASGAVFGGAGLVTTLDPVTDAVVSTTVRALAGSTLQVGTGELAAEKLVIDGDLVLTDATLAFVAFGGTHTRLEVTERTSATGTNIVNLQNFVTGSYNFGAIASLLATSDTVLLQVNGVTPATGGRQGANWIGDPVDLMVDLWSDRARVMDWTGSAGNFAWNNADDNWSSRDNGGAMTKYAAGDKVIFSATEALAVALDSNVTVSGIDVGGTGTLRFTGLHGITSTPWLGGDADQGVLDAGGKLVKRDSGTLVFENGANLFEGGIELRGGSVEFVDGNQLRTPGAAIVFVESATLRANADTSLDNAMSIASGKTAVIDTNGRALTHIGGGISGAGRFVKIGAGVLTLATANSHAGGTELVEGGLELAHSQALGTGALALSQSGTVLGVAGGLSVTNDIVLNVAHAVVRNNGGAATTLAGAITGGGVLTAAGNGSFVFAGENTLAAFVVAPGAHAMAAGPRALGGDTSDVSVGQGGALTVGLAGGQTTLARSLTVSGGTLAFSHLEGFTGNTPLLTVSGTLALADHAVVSIATALQSDRYALLRTGSIIGTEGADFTVDKGAANAGREMALAMDRDGTVFLISMDQSANPGKGIAVTYDAIIAATTAVFSRLSERLLIPIEERNTGDLKRNLWLKGVGTFGKYDATGDKVGYEDDTYGVVLGYDSMLSQNTLFGMYLGQIESTLKTSNGAETDMDTPYAGVYGSTRIGSAYVAADLMYAVPDAKTSRWETYGYADGSHKAKAFSGSAEAGLLLGSRKSVLVKPAVGVHYMNIEFERHTESGPGAMTVDGFRAGILQAYLNLQTTQQFKTPWGQPGMFDVRAGWHGNLKDSKTAIKVAFVRDPAGKIDIMADEYGHNAFMLGAGLRLSLGRNAMFHISYDCEKGADYARNTISGSIRWLW